MSRKQQGTHKDGGCAKAGRARPHTCGPLVSPSNYFLRLYILKYSQTNQESHKNTFPPPQPSVPMRSHLGAFSDVLPEGDSITEGFYINTIASLMKREQFTTDLQVHSQQLDGFFSLFDSQYHVFLDVLGDLFDGIFFCDAFVEIR